MTSRRQLVAGTWIIGSVAYGVVRALLVWRFLSPYGVNVIAFSSVEVTTSLVFGWMSSRLVTGVIDGKWKRAVTSLAPTIAAYIAPDAYVLLTVGRLPPSTWKVLIAIVATSSFITLAGITRQIIQGQRSRKSDQKLPMNPM